MNQPMYFEIQASQPKKLVQFYGQIFNWTFEQDTNLPIEYWRITTEGIGGAILQRPVAVPELMQGTNAFTLSMEVKNFDQTAQKILEEHGQEAMAKFAIPGKCWQGYYIDPDHNVFGIFEVDTKAA